MGGSEFLVLYWQALDFCIKKVVQISNGKGRFVDQLFQLGNESAGEENGPTPFAVLLNAQAAMSSVAPLPVTVLDWVPGVINIT